MGRHTADTAPARGPFHRRRRPTPAHHARVTPPAGSLPVLVGGAAVPAGARTATTTPAGATIPAGARTATTPAGPPPCARATHPVRRALLLAVPLMACALVPASTSPVTRASAATPTLPSGAQPGDTSPRTLPKPLLEWAPPTRLDTGAPYVAEYAPSDVSCPGTTLCVAVDASGTVLTSTEPAGDASTWTRHAALPLSGTGAPRLACPSATLCVVVEGDRAHTAPSPTAPASAWTTTRLDVEGAVETLQCPSVTLCAVLDRQGTLHVTADPTRSGTTRSDPTRSGTTRSGTTRSGTTWTEVHVSDGLETLTCPTDSWCLGSDAYGTVHVTGTPLDAASWRPVDRPDIAPDSISCTGPSLCVAVGTELDSEDEEVTVVATTTRPEAAPETQTWENTTLRERTAHSRVRCFPTGTCVLTGDGEITVSEDPTGDADAWHAGPAPRGADAVSCPSAELCVVRGDEGLTVSENPTGGRDAWRLLRGMHPYTPFSAVDCVPGLCVAVDAAGHVATSTAPASGTWRTTALVHGRELSAVDCRSESWCVATDTEGNAWVSSSPADGRWTEHRVRRGAHLVAVSCASTELCVATTAKGGLYSTRDPEGRWHRRAVRRGLRLGAVSCPSERLCVATGPGRALTSTAPLTTRWRSLSLPDSTGEGATADVSCSSARFCVLATASSRGSHLSVSTSPAGGSKRWTRVRTDPALHRVHCLASTACYGLAAQASEDLPWTVVATSTPRAAGAWTPVSAGIPPLGEGLACAGASLCATVRGNAVAVGAVELRPDR